MGLLNRLFVLTQSGRAGPKETGGPLSDRPFQDRKDRSAHRAGDVAEHAVDLGADAAHGNDRGNCDQRGDQRVFDGGGAMLVLHQAAENGQHLYLHGKKRL